MKKNIEAGEKYTVKSIDGVDLGTVEVVAYKGPAGTNNFLKMLGHVWYVKPSIRLSAKSDKKYSAIPESYLYEIKEELRVEEILMKDDKFGCEAPNEVISWWDMLDDNLFVPDDVLDDMAD